MVILHIASITDYAFSGVCIVVPKHIRYQGLFSQTALLNIANVQIESVGEQFEYKPPFCLEDLPVPFNRPDLVVFHEVYRVEYLKISYVLRKCGIPYVVIPHGEISTVAQKRKWLKKKTADFLLFNHFVNNAVAVQCLSQREFDTTFVRNHKIIASNGIEKQPVVKEQFHTDLTKFLFVGRLNMDQKGLDILVDAVCLNKAFFKENNCSFDIYGPDLNGRYQQLFEYIEKRDAFDLINLHHEITGQDKIDLQLSSDVFVQTSRFEGMPMGILEAMSLGLPCVVTEGTCMNSFVGQYDAGWIADTNPESVSEALEKAIVEREQLKTKSENALKLVDDMFLWEKIAKNTVDEYGRLIKGE